MYTRRVVVDSRIALYNTFTDNLLLLQPAIDELLQTNISSIGKIKDVHPELFSELVGKGFIVKDSVAEHLSVQREWSDDSNDSSKFTLIVNPTLSCNMRCWYCYETHLASTSMSLDVLKNVKKFVSEKIREKGLKGFNLDFFGGEPLLAYTQCVKNLISYVREECIKFGKKFYLSFTTNGYLLDEKILSDLDDLTSDHAEVKLQITLDGNESCHNNTRKLGGRFPTYGKILSNAVNALKHNTKVLLRLNYTDDNILSFYDVIDNLESMCTINEKRKLLISFHRVWQNADSPKLKEDVSKVMDAFEESGFEVEDTLIASKVRCYGDKNNTVVMNYDGKVYKCTARDFNKENSEGYLSDNGDIIWNGRHKKRIDSNNKFKTCQSCVLYPICHAGCSQNRLETPDTTKCVRGYSSQNKDNIIREVVSHKIEKYIKNEMA